MGPLPIGNDRDGYRPAGARRRRRRSSGRGARAPRRGGPVTCARRPRTPSARSSPRARRVAARGTAARVPEEPLEVAQGVLQEYRQEHRLPEERGGLGRAMLAGATRAFRLNVCVSGRRRRCSSQSMSRPRMRIGPRWGPAKGSPRARRSMTRPNRQLAKLGTLERAHIGRWPSNRPTACKHFVQANCIETNYRKACIRRDRHACKCLVLAIAAVHCMLSSAACLQLAARTGRRRQLEDESQHLGRGHRFGRSTRSGRRPRGGRLPADVLPRRRRRESQQKRRLRRAGRVRLGGERRTPARCRCRC